MAFSLLFSCLGVEFEQSAPTAGSVDRLAHCRGAVAHTLEIAMFEIDSRAFALGREGDFNLGDQIRVVFPLRAELPNEDQPGRRIPHEHLANLAFGAVDIAFVPAAALARLDDRAVEIGRSDLVRCGPPAADAIGEDLERALGRRSDADALAHGRRADLGAHRSSFLLFSLRSTSAEKAASAASQNWSSQARMAPSPFGSM